jgi:hypothetical protein
MAMNLSIRQKADGGDAATFRNAQNVDALQYLSMETKKRKPPAAAHRSNMKEFMNVTVTINGLVTRLPIDFPLDLSRASTA